MAGGPSQLELFDYKPKLQQMDGKVIPSSYVENKRFAFIKKDAKLLGTRRQFLRWGGQRPADLFAASPPGFDRRRRGDRANGQDRGVQPRSSQAVHEYRFQPVRTPSMGSWVTYGLGSPSGNLPGFVVLHSGPRGPRGGTPLWGNGFLPSRYQGVPFLNGADPILNLSSPGGIDRESQGQFVRAVNRLNALRLKQVGTPRSRPGSAPTRWPTGCSPAPPH
ncbi:MAG: hypothetical protein Ct9H300mP1_00220 [Planctomycetaceae bacterium]|nr:MAG: hypothetical protein Ct9H300mP1_00220 [Planctomycetaceae bacterium]